MMKKLRKDASEKLSKIRGNGSMSKLIAEPSKEMLERALYELRLHKVELEMQNDEIRQHQMELEESRKRYADLFDFAPVSYFTLDNKAFIKDVNVMGCELLMTDRKKLIGNRFQSFIHPDSYQDFYSFFKDILEKKEKKQEIKLLQPDKDKGFRYALLKGIYNRNEEEECRLAIFDITDEKKSAEKIRSINELQAKISQQRQKETLTAIINAQEEERKRIAESLHNGIGQILYAIKIRLEQAGTEPGNKKILFELQQLVEECIRDTRNISFELMPTVLKDFGLVVAVEEICNRFRNEKLNIECNFKGLEERIDEVSEISAYRIIQELVNNIVKHSGADYAFIEIENLSNKLKIYIEDNGRGFSAEKAISGQKGIGLSAIKNRIDVQDGRLKIKSSIGKGSLIEIEIQK
jgi:two-component system, chemotaxis family, CheB/CheR fusion protein